MRGAKRGKQKKKGRKKRTERERGEAKAAQCAPIKVSKVGALLIEALRLPINGCTVMMKPIIDIFNLRSQSKPVSVSKQFAHQQQIQDLLNT